MLKQTASMYAHQMDNLIERMCYLCHYREQLQLCIVTEESISNFFMDHLVSWLKDMEGSGFKLNTDRSTPSRV